MKTLRTLGSAILKTPSIAFFLVIGIWFILMAMGAFLPSHDELESTHKVTQELAPPKVENTAKHRLTTHTSDVPNRFYAFCLAKADGSRPRELAGLIKAMIAKDVLTVEAMLSDPRGPCLDTRFFGVPPILATVVDQFESFYASGNCKIVVKIRGYSGTLAYSWVPCVVYQGPSFPASLPLGLQGTIIVTALA